MNVGKKKLLIAFPLALSLLFSTTHIDNSVVEAKTTDKKPSKKKTPLTTKKASSLSTKDPYGKVSKVYYRGIEVKGTNAIEQYIAFEMFKGNKKISLKKYTGTKKKVSFNYVMTNVKEMNPILQGVKGFKFTGKVKNSIPEYLLVSHSQTKAITDIQYSQVYKEIDKVVTAIKKKKTKDEKYQEIYNYISEKVRTNNYMTNKTLNGKKYKNYEEIVQFAKDNSVWGVMIQKSANSHAIAKTYKYIAQQCGLKSNIVTAKKSGSLIYLNTQVYDNNYITLTDVTKGYLTTGIPKYAVSMSLSQLYKLGYSNIVVKDPVILVDSNKEYYTTKDLKVTSFSDLANTVHKMTNKSTVSKNFVVYAPNGIELEYTPKNLESYLEKALNKNYSIGISKLTPSYYVITAIPGKSFVKQTTPKQ